jgi:DsbC/DsbD-like thiol-disulfide interchange protein
VVLEFPLETGQMSHLVVSLRLSCLLTLVILLPGVRASAASIPHGTVDLVAENQWIAPGRRTYFGLNFQLEKGWHIYWINPGDSGQPPRVQWHLPDGLSVGEIEWPAPRRLGTSTIVDFGYDGAVMLLVPVRASSTLPVRQVARIVAELSVLVCREICVPGRTQISLSLPIESTAPEPDTRGSELFTAARKSLPRKPPDDWKFTVNNKKDSFILIANFGRQVTRAAFFPLAESQIDNSAPQVIVPAATGFALTLRKSDQLLVPIKRLEGVLELSATQTYVIDVAVRDAL